MCQTYLEDWISNEYKHKNIKKVQDLNIENLSVAFQVEIVLHTHKSNCIYDDEYSVIFLNKDQSIEKQREDFFHELCHILFHVGDQRSIPKEFCELQENQARRFGLYAAMPKHILDTYLSYPPEEIAEIFTLPKCMVIDRLTQIKNRHLFKKQQKNLFKIKNPYKRKSYDPSQWSDETWRVMNQLKKQTGKEVINYVGLLRRD
ncbi:ImmA/IrrE family metallo-endopeptidase [Halalkalibacterium halodurans]|uniref:ImmA/IrrE family metallo-endopeptidase n=1 Tax=Halalkalibacterium halodurans TaxID=86665 RepID=UPI0006A9A5E8|nr:ImmA/IrrE family metallo-endopeptidase [Halalkalibacterium halodurans]